MTFGSVTWARRDEGRMTGGERLAETLRGVFAVAKARLRDLGPRGRQFEMALSEVPMPSTPLIAAARAALAGAPPWVLSHSVRSYIWGWIFGRKDGLRADAELLLTMALLHDIGLVESEGAACFALRGGLRAREIAVSAGANAGTADRIADGITLHLNVTPTGSDEARLLRIGSGCDVVAARLGELSPTTRREVLAAHPRGDFLDKVSEALRANARPGTRAELLLNRLGFLRLAAEAETRFAKAGG